MPVPACRTEQRGVYLLMPKKEKNNIKIISTVLSLALLLGLCVMMLVAWLQGHFESEETLTAYIDSFGVFGWIVLTVIQAVQVVLPVLPGFLGCIVGGILYGWWWGFWANYIGISLGSLIAFMLARKYGQGLVDKMFPGKRYQKLSRWAGESKSYTALLAVAILLPLFPDDFFCYFSGVTKMTFRKFTLILLLTKPWCILVYSLLFSGVLTN